MKKLKLILTLIISFSAFLLCISCNTNNDSDEKTPTPSSTKKIIENTELIIAPTDSNYESESYKISNVYSLSNNPNKIYLTIEAKELSDSKNKEETGYWVGFALTQKTAEIEESSEIQFSTGDFTISTNINYEESKKISKADFTYENEGKKYYCVYFNWQSNAKKQYFSLKDKKTYIVSFNIIPEIKDIKISHKETEKSKFETNDQRLSQEEKRIEYPTGDEITENADYHLYLSKQNDKETTYLSSDEFTVSAEPEGALLKNLKFTIKENGVTVLAEKSFLEARTTETKEKAQDIEAKYAIVTPNQNGDFTVKAKNSGVTTIEIQTGSVTKTINIVVLENSEKENQ